MSNFFLYTILLSTISLPPSLSLSLSLSSHGVDRYLQHGITCIGFRDKEEKERFCHQLKRAVCWLGERAQKQKEKVMEAGERQRRGRDETDSPEHQ